MKEYKTFLFILSVLTFFGVHIQAQTLVGADIDGEAAGDQSGFSVSMPDAHTVAIGANINDGSAMNAGHVRVYRWDGGNWIQKGADIDGEAANDYCGIAVSMPDSNTVAVGANGNNGNGTDAGHVRVFEWNGSAWVQKGADIDGEAGYDNSGLPVRMPDANTIAIGASGNSDNGSYAGQVRIYTWNGNAWVQKGGDIDGEASGDESGYALSMPDSNTVAIGAPYNSGSYSYAGHVRIYHWDNNAWVQKGADIDGEGADEESGWAVDMPDANWVAIGAHASNATDSLAGQVRVYRWNGSAWIQKGAGINGEAAHDLFGSSISMPDTNTLAVGAIGNTGNGAAAGHVRIYHWNGNAWTQFGTDIDGEAAGDQCGWAVSMPDAHTVAVGARSNDGNGISAGHVRVFHLCVETSSTVNLSACNSYTSPSGTYAWTASGTYMDTISNVAGCDSIVTVQLEIFSDYAVTIDTTITAGESFGGYTTTGNYMDTFQSSQGCDSIITIHLTVETSTGSYPLSKGGEMRFHPNPADNQLYIESSVNISWVKIYDIMGNLVESQQMNGTRTSINTTKLSSGIYFIHVGVKDDQVMRQKMIKK